MSKRNPIYVPVQELNDYNELTSPGIEKLIVKSIGDYHNEALADAMDDYEKSVLVNFCAFETRKGDAIADAIEDDKLDIANNPLLFTHELIFTSDRTPEVPMAGETVKVALVYATKKGEIVLDKNGEQILNIKGKMVLQGAKKKKTRKFGSSASTEKKAKNIVATADDARDAF